ncbi:SPW repeat protein [Streptomyces gilvus]|uniref:SPW repeat protein n=1 Tax=Streptomyces gilvus TaxID=2920937 RepID=UPI001F0F1427|nr:SPW repeat protein [Streptomyces sp. CME 23]MCH5672463.1 SPW repeat protein [Streptomyces sp. CME 23]
MATHPHIEQHPDLIALRARYAETSALPVTQATEGLTLLTGLYLAISPWVVGFNGDPLAVSNLVTGIALAVLAIGFGSAYERTYGMGWVAMAIGIWAIIAPWAVQHASATTGTIVSNVVTGAVAVLLGLVTTGMAARGPRRAVTPAR